MGFAVELFFNTEAEQKIIDLWHALSTAGISSTMPDIGSRPHISLAVWDTLDVSELQPELASFADNAQSFCISLNNIGSFADSGAVYLEPETSEQLGAIHTSFYSHIQPLQDGIWEYYKPGRWVPHCALAVDLSRDVVPRAIELCQDLHQPIEARVEQIGIVEFRPVQHLLTYRLK